MLAADASIGCASIELGASARPLLLYRSGPIEQVFVACKSVERDRHASRSADLIARRRHANTAIPTCNIVLVSNLTWLNQHLLDKVTCSSV